MRKSSAIGGGQRRVFDLANAPQIARELGKKTAIGAWIGRYAASGGGRVVLYDFAKQSIVSSTTAPLADSLTTNGECRLS